MNGKLYNYVCVGLYDTSNLPMPSTHYKPRRYDAFSIVYRRIIYSTCSRYISPVFKPAVFSMTAMYRPPHCTSCVLFTLTICAYQIGLPANFLQAVDGAL